MLWQPILKYLEDLLNDRSPTWTSQLRRNHEALEQEMAGHVDAPGSSMTQDEWFQFVQNMVSDMVSVSIPLELVRHALAPLSVRDWEPSRANALHVLRSSAFCSRLVGPTLATQMSRKVLALVSDMSVPLLSEEGLQQGLKTDIVGLLTHTHCKPESDDERHSTPSKKKSRTTQSRMDIWTAKTKEVLWILENRMCVSRGKGALLSAVHPMKELGSSVHLMGLTNWKGYWCVGKSKWITC